MIRNLKVLGLALVAVFAMSAVAASAASAQQGFLTSDGPVTLTAEETGEKANFLKAFGLKVACEGSTYTGHKYNVTPHELIPSGATTITLTPHYAQENCEVVGLGFPATVDTNGCDYVLHIGETVAEPADTYGGTVDVVCPAEKEIVVTAFTNATDHANNVPFCAIHVKGQTGLTGATATDTTNGTVDLRGTVKGIHVVRTNFGTHNILCPNGTTKETGEFQLDVSVTGHDSEGEPTGISLSHN